MTGWIERSLGLDGGEGRLAVLGAGQFFLLMFAYFMLRPLREAMGLVGGVDELSRLYLINVTVMVGLNVVFGAVVSRAAKRRLTLIVYRAAMVCLGVFAALLWRSGGEPSVLVGKFFYVWLSVFNVFAVSLFWALMADLQRPAQSKRLFGVVAVGGTAGAIVGSAWAMTFVNAFGAIGLIACAIVVLEAGARVSMGHRGGGVRGATEPVRIGGDAWAGFVRLARSPYLMAIGVFILLHTSVSTFVYFQKMEIVAMSASGAEARAGLFAAITLWGQVLTVLVQVFLAGRLMRRWGVGSLMCVVPLVSIAGFATIEVSATLVSVAVFEAVRNASHYALGKPARETLFTVLATEEKYKAKAAMDTFVYRGGDSLGALVYQVVARAGVPFLWVVGPMCVTAMATAWWLGRREEQCERGARGDAWEGHGGVAVSAAKLGSEAISYKEP